MSDTRLTDLEALSRRAFLRGMMVTSAGLLVPKPASIFLPTPPLVKPHCGLLIVDEDVRAEPGLVYSKVAWRPGATGRLIVSGFGVQMQELDLTYAPPVGAVVSTGLLDL